MPRAFLIKNKKHPPGHVPPPGGLQDSGRTVEEAGRGEEERGDEESRTGADQDQSPARPASCPVDPTCIYPSPSPSSEESLCPRDDTSTSSSDDEPRDLTSSRDLNDVSPSLSPEGSWGGLMPRPPLLLSPRTSPEPEEDDYSLDRNTPSPKRRRSDGDDEFGIPMRLAPSSRSDVTLRHQEQTMMTSSANCIPRGGGHGGSGGETLWQSHLAGMGLGISMAVHHPYLALSFRRLQELHMRAAQEGLPKLSPFHPHLPLASPHHPGQTPVMPFAPLPPGPPGPPGLSSSLPTSVSTLSTPTSPVQGCPGDYPFPPHARLERRVDFMPPASTSRVVQGGGSVASPTSSSMSLRASPPPPGVLLDALPLDLDTKTAAEKRKRREGEPPRYNCEACGKTYSTFSGLSKHKQFHCASHIQKQFNCKYCEKTYVSLGALKMHIRTHTLPCKCHLCGKAFSRPWLLQGHVRTHTGEKPFQCAHCGRSFADRSNLRAHLQTHSDVKKYSCRTCSKTFSRMSLLLKHEDGGCAGISH